MNGHTALILGAGASLNYGLPLGSQLVEKICKLLPSSDTVRMGSEANLLYNFFVNDAAAVRGWQQISQKEYSYALIEFRDRLIQSAPKSIDEFLSRDFGDANPLFRLIGKLSIAQVIASCESVSAIEDGVAPEKQPDHWYNYLWQDCLNNGTPGLEALRAKHLKIISFNYDRSLEYFLARRIAATYLTPPGTAPSTSTVNKWADAGFKEVETKFDITHPYGTLGSLSKIPYGSTDNFKYYGQTMANSIHVIGEERKNGDGFEVAKKWIAEAQQVVFLGFSFDVTNMRRLGLADGLPSSYLTEEGHVIREVFPMTYGFEKAERAKLVQRYFQQFGWDTTLVSSGNTLPVSQPSFNPTITNYLRHFGCLANI
jgi:hypothetical protein